MSNPETTKKRITASDLLLAGWHRISDANGVYWAFPHRPTICKKFSFSLAVAAYKAGIRDE